MEYLTGLALGVLIAILGRVLSFDQDKSFYPVILIVVAFYYVLFSIMSRNTDTILYEIVIALVFTITALFSSKYSMYIVAAGLILHGVYDAAHDLILINTGVPIWWPGFCAAFDVVLGVIVIYLTKSRSNKLLQPTIESRG